MSDEKYSAAEADEIMRVAGRIVSLIGAILDRHHADIRGGIAVVTAANLVARVLYMSSLSPAPRYTKEALLANFARAVDASLVDLVRQKQGGA